ncbi:predicted protein [Uncinocarpus reesii 1704]|uniref:RING-type domain-containing protein n=1 Tax=Uncinocarpus reesii (strain UAMH 1704) TaxID=336963 RepID=C4JEM5_UNCRE|nr:uncharacterized protein UREG_02185 [Uncinocarpus reesii 1704]EEP77336.1 predicted protein [Uncinocarpus reesii 1704]
MPSPALLGCICLSVLLSPVAAQDARPSDGLVQTPPLGAPQFFLRTRQFDMQPVYLVPLNQSMSDRPPEGFNATGTLVDVSPENASQLDESQIALVSCDDSAYPGILKVNDTLEMLIARSPTAAATILYSLESKYCAYDPDPSLPPYPNIFSITRPPLAGEVLRKLDSSPRGTSSILAEAPSPSADEGSIATSYPDSSMERNRQNNNTPTTSVAMIILYAVTGVITLLFLGVIVTGAVRAHLHPERYGPRNVAGRPRQSRAKGIARAMLETLPIVKFDDLDEPATQPSTARKSADVEMGAQQQQRGQQEHLADDKELAGRDARPSLDSRATNRDGQIGSAASSPPRAGTLDEPPIETAGTLGCPICTDDFEKRAGCPPAALRPQVPPRVHRPVAGERVWDLSSLPNRPPPSILRRRRSHGRRRHLRHPHGARLRPTAAAAPAGQQRARQRTRGQPPSAPPQPGDVHPVDHQRDAAQRRVDRAATRGGAAAAVRHGGNGRDWAVCERGTEEPALLDVAVGFVQDSHATPRR